MEIHKPKAAHSWREFLTEIGTIVCGILIALGLEQGVEWFHWRERVENAEVRLNGEVTNIYMNALEWQMLQPCYERRLKDLNAALMQRGTMWTPLPPIRSVFLGDVPCTTSFRSWTDEIWKAYVADGTTPRLSRERSEAYGSLYDVAQTAHEDNEKAFLGASALDPLGARHDFSASFRESALLKVAELRRLTSKVNLISGQMIYHIERFKVADRPAAERWVRDNAYLYKACYERGLLGTAPPPGANPGLNTTLPPSGILKDKN
jgi:hypothetical protein